MSEEKTPETSVPKSLGWFHKVSFTINKDVDGGAVEKKLKELGLTVRILAIEKQELVEKTS